jgi:taurine dioxygenase
MNEHEHTQLLGPGPEWVEPRIADLLARDIAAGRTREALRCFVDPDSALRLDRHPAAPGREEKEMGYQTIDVRKLTPTIGAEIHGVDLSRTLGNQQYEDIHQALVENLVIFFRDQTISVDQQKDFGRRFGKLHIHPAAPKGLEQHPEILVIKADEKSKRVAGEEWHSDVSCDPEPPMGSILYLTTVPPDGGGDTMFANMYRAYETLSEPIRNLLVGLTAVHDGEHVFRGRYGLKDEGKVFPRSEHPVIRTHPVTGKKLLFVNRGFTTRIVQLKRDESAAVLEMLFRHIETPELHCRFKWQVNSIAFWDNRCAQHHALWDYFPAKRYGHRVTICGDKPFYRA